MSTVSATASTSAATLNPKKFSALRWVSALTDSTDYLHDLVALCVQRGYKQLPRLREVFKQGELRPFQFSHLFKQYCPEGRTFLVYAPNQKFSLVRGFLALATSDALRGKTVRMVDNDSHNLLGISLLPTAADYDVVFYLSTSPEHLMEVPEVTPLDGVILLNSNKQEHPAWCDLDARPDLFNNLSAHFMVFDLYPFPETEKQLRDDLNAALSKFEGRLHRHDYLKHVRDFLSSSFIALPQLGGTARPASVLSVPLNLSDDELALKERNHEQWLENLRTLKEYCASVGYYPNQKTVFNGSNIGLWFYYNYRLFRQGKMSEFRKQHFMEVLPEEVTQEDGNDLDSYWLLRYSQLRYFVSQYKRLPRPVERMQEGVPIGAWYQGQLRLCRRGQLSPVKETLLSKLFT